jgi:hypothetical protein
MFRYLEHWLQGFESSLGVNPIRNMRGPFSAEQRVPHAQLRLALQGDAAMDALLPGLPGCVSLGEDEGAPFRVLQSGLIRLPAVLVMDSAAAAIAARWGAEALHAVQSGRVDHRRVVGLLRHGARLLEISPAPARDLLFGIMPGEVAAELWETRAERPSRRLCEWQVSLIEGVGGVACCDEVHARLELELPMEVLLAAGGDSRLLVDRASGLNRYGVCPRPRPEAVHFSSSTASAISEHGFLYCDLVRRSLLDAVLKEGSTGRYRRAMVEATFRAIEELLKLASAEVDMAMTASGTDAELVAVMVALAGAEGRPLTNLLVAPEESGKAVRLAGAGQFFDGVSATGAPIQKGASAFAGRQIEAKEVAIRDEAFRVRSAEAIDAAWTAEARDALDRGHQVLAHVLWGSKTGLSAPSVEAVEALVAMAPDRVDVVVDACQMRSSWEELGEMVRRGWMVQISGSKFLTGPPFSGALLIPTALRDRAVAVKDMLASAPGVSQAEDWSLSWVGAAGGPVKEGSFGPVFRWLPALMEGQLYSGLGEEQRYRAFERFRTVLVECIQRSPYLEPLGEALSGESAADMGRLSIMSFQVKGRLWDGRLEALDERGCQWLFEQLNRDLTGMVANMAPVDQAAARLCCHIGQPVVLTGESGKLAFLRLVLGARFFNIVGHAEEGAGEAALESEIADAKRVLGKIEWLASQWWRFRSLVGAN